MGYWRLPLLLLAPVLIIAMFAKEGGVVSLLWDPMAMIVVVPGSLLATFIPAPVDAIRHLRHALLHLPADRSPLRHGTTRQSPDGVGQYPSP